MEGVRGGSLSFGLSLGFGVGSRVRIGIGWCRARGWSWGWGWTRSWGRGGGRGNIAPSLMPLHVPHTSDGLDLRCSGSPIIPVLEVSLLKHILAPSVTWIHVSYPPSRGRETVSHFWDSDFYTNLVSFCTNALLSYISWLQF